MERAYRDRPPREVSEQMDPCHSLVQYASLTLIDDALVSQQITCEKVRLYPMQSMKCKQLTSGPVRENSCVYRDVSLQHTRERALLFCCRCAKVLAVIGEDESHIRNEAFRVIGPTYVRVTSVVPSRYCAEPRRRPVRGHRSVASPLTSGVT